MLGHDVGAQNAVSRHWRSECWVTTSALRMLGHDVGTKKAGSRAALRKPGHDVGIKKYGSWAALRKLGYDVGTKKAGSRAALRKLGHDVCAQKAGPRRRHLECWATASALRIPNRKWIMPFLFSHCPDFKQCLKGYQSITGGGGGNVFTIELWSGRGGGVRQSSPQI